MEVNIGNEGNSNFFLNLSDRAGSCLIYHGHPNDFAACLFETPYLGGRLSDIPRIGLGHRLDGKGGIPSNLD
jgi:hypothetical protein